MSACEECWSRAFEIAIRSGRHQVDVYRELVRQTAFPLPRIRRRAS